MTLVCKDHSGFVWKYQAHSGHVFLLPNSVTFGETFFKLTMLIGVSTLKTTLWGSSPPFPLIQSSHHFLMSHASADPLAYTRQFAYQSLLSLLINLSVKISFLPVVSLTGSMFSKTLQQHSPLSCQVGWRLIKLSW